MSHLFSPLKLRELTAKNRIVMSPMCQYSSIDGFANDWHMVHIGTRAVGGVGTILTEATAVSPEGRISPSDLGIWKDEHIENLKKITNFVLQYNALPGIQLAHAGRKASHGKPWEGGKFLSTSNGGWKTIAPSNLPFSEESDIPEALTTEGINKIIASFKAAAIRSLHAGFKIIEIHAAHGYLIHEFLSPLSNKRTDEYGGSFENRIRLLVQTVETVRNVWPDEFPLFVRISASDWVPEGWTIEDSVELSKILKNKGVDLIDCSSGGIVPGVKIPVGPGYQVPFADQIKNNAGILTGAVGLITKADHAESILSEGKADMIVMAKEILRNPYFALQAAQQLNENIDWPSQYRLAKL